MHEPLMPSLDMDLRLAARREEADGIESFELVHPEGHLLPSFEAGAHILVQAAPGVLRAYSLCNDPSERHRYLIGVLRTSDSRGGSVALHEALHAGMLIRTSRPRNAFGLANGASRSILLGGGIGITPLLAMAAHLAAAQADFVLHYCTRDASRTAFTGHIAQASYARNVRFHQDDGPDVQRFNAAQALGQPTPGTHVYVCGPAGFIAHAMSTAKGLGWPASQLHSEYFTPPAAPADELAAEAAFDLVLTSSGRRIAVRAGQSAAHALQDAGVPLVMSCEQGICGTCVTTVLQGTPDHRDHYLTDEDRRRNDCFMPCCSRACSAELVLDL